MFKLYSRYPRIIIHNFQCYGKYKLNLQRDFGRSCLLDSSESLPVPRIHETGLIPLEPKILQHPAVYDLDIEDLLLQSRKDEMKRSPSRPLVEIGEDAEEILGSEKFSMKSSLSSVFGMYNDIVTLYTMKNSDADHPLCYIAEIIIAESKQGIQGGPNPFLHWRSMMVTLATEIFGYSDEMRGSSEDILRLVAERHSHMQRIVEIGFTAELIHKWIIHTSGMDLHNSKLTTLNNANKAATLIGDLLLTQQMVHMAALKCPPVTALMWASVMDYCESEFVLGGVNSSSSMVFNKNGWILKTQLGLGSLMGNAISAMLLFNGHGENVRDLGFRLGSLMGLTYQAYEDLKFFERSGLCCSNWIDLGMLPIVCKVRNEPELLSYPAQNIFQSVKSDETVMGEAIEIFSVLQNETIRYLDFIQGAYEAEASQKSQITLKSFLQSMYTL